MTKHLVWIVITTSSCFVTFKVTVKADQKVMFRLLEHDIQYDSIFASSYYFLAHYTRVLKKTDSLARRAKDSLPDGSPLL